jgi:hypothetical protein
MARPHEELYELCDCLCSVSIGLDSYEPESQLLPGLRFLREEVKRDLQVLQKVCPVSIRSKATHHGISL